MKSAIIRSSWMEGYGYRLDTKPYLGGALETKILLEKLPLRKDPLHTLTKGFDGGIYNGPQFVRRYVESAECGVPFITGSTMQLADLSNLPLLSRRDAHGPKLRHLEIQPGMSLISCSGTIGKMAYARSDMRGVWSSQDVLKVVPDPARIPSGYLYAYLCSKFGIPLVVSGTYGAIIQHLEPEHIAGLPVPRLGDAIENEVHALVEAAAELRTRASETFHRAMSGFEEAAGLLQSKGGLPDPGRLVTTVLSSALAGRLDTNFHSAWHHAAIRPFIEGKVRPTTVGQMARSVFEPSRFKRIEHDEPDHCVPLFGTGSIGDVDPEPISLIARFQGHEAYTVSPTTVLIPRSGQLNGIIGTATLPIGGVRTGVVSEHAIRVNCRNEVDAGYLYLALRSRWGLAQLKARAFGGSIPTLDVSNVSAVLVPNLPPEVRGNLGEQGFEVARLRTDAIQKERRAREILVDALETAGRE